MNLKEAVQAQNKISELLSHIVRYLSDEDYVITVTEKDTRSKALAGHTDDTVDVSKNKRMFLFALQEMAKDARAATNYKKAMIRAMCSIMTATDPYVAKATEISAKHISMT